MSQVKISGNASGTGTLTISAPNTNTDRTLSLPDNTGTIITTESTQSKVPVVALIGNTQTTSSSSFTYSVITWNTSSSYHIDTASIFNSSNNRVVPNVAGYYQCHFTCNTSNTDRIISIIQRNGNFTIAGLQKWDDGNTVTKFGTTIFGIAYFNGTTDYLEFKHLADGTSRSVEDIRGSVVFLRGA